MKAIRVASATALLLLLASPASLFAQKDDHAQGDNHQQGGKQDDQQKQPDQAPAQQQRGQAKPEKQASRSQLAKQQEPQHVAGVKTAAAPKQNQQQPKQQIKPAQHSEQANSRRFVAQPKQENHGNSSQPEHLQRTAAEQHTQRSAPALRLSVRSNGRIPDDRFRSNFGRGHEFHMGNPQMVGGYSRFQYGGYWFGFVQPWPVGWYYTDDVYVDYIDGGYYLCNPFYPNARVSISVVL